MPKAREKPSILPVVIPLGLLLAVSGILSLGELEYLLRARRATAIVDSSERVMTPGPRRGARIFQEVAYHFRDASGSEHHGRDRLANYWEAPAAGKRIRVEYLPGRPGSERVVGNGAKVAPALFVFSMLAFVAVGAVLAWEQRAKHRRRRDRRS